MSARSALVPKYGLHKPSGREHVRIHGKVVYTGGYGTAESKQEYGRLAASSGCAVSTGSASQVTVVELVAAYLDYAEGYYQRNGQPTRSLYNIKLALSAGWPATRASRQTPPTTIGR